MSVTTSGLCLMALQIFGMYLFGATMIPFPPFLQRSDCILDAFNSEHRVEVRNSAAIPWPRVSRSIRWWNREVALTPFRITQSFSLSPCTSFSRLTAKSAAILLNCDEYSSSGRWLKKYSQWQFLASAGEQYNGSQVLVSTQLPFFSTTPSDQASLKMAGKNSCSWQLILYKVLLPGRWRSLLGTLHLGRPSVNSHLWKTIGRAETACRTHGIGISYMILLQFAMKMKPDSMWANKIYIPVLLYGL